MKKNIFRISLYAFIFFNFSEGHCDMPKKDDALRSSDVLSFFDAPSIAPRVTGAPKARPEYLIEQEMKLALKLEEQERSALREARSIWDAICRFEKMEIHAGKFIRKLNRYAERISRLETTWFRDPEFKYDADFMLEKLLNIRDAANEQNISAEDLCLAGKYSLFQYKDQLTTHPGTLTRPN